MALYNVHVYYETITDSEYTDHVYDWEYDHYPTPAEIYDGILLDLKNIDIDNMYLLQDSIATTIVQKPGENQ